MPMLDNLMFTSDPIHMGYFKPRHVRDVHAFQPGDLYFVRYMTGPTIVTVQARTEDSVTVFFGTLAIEDFNKRVLFYLGRRMRLLGLFWLPWARINPRRVVELGLADSLGTDAAFWNGERHHAPTAPAAADLQRQQPES